MENTCLLLVLFGLFPLFSGKVPGDLLVSSLAHVNLPPEDNAVVLIPSQGEGVTESGLRVRTRVTVPLSARGGERRLLRIT